METSHVPAVAAIGLNGGSGVRKLTSPRPKPRPAATAISPRSGSTLPQHRRIQCIGHYDLDKTIGQGQFGKVKLATHVLTGERVHLLFLCHCGEPLEVSIHSSSSGCCENYSQEQA
jgi:hypothetical protein